MFQMSVRYFRQSYWDESYVGEFKYLFFLLDAKYIARLALAHLDNLHLYYVFFRVRLP
jgi:hypothetical protein